jgi:predicted kinase
MSGAPALVVVCGLPGVGKSRVSQTVVDSLDATLIRTDVVRKDLVDDPEYTTDETERVYATVRERARETVADGGRAVLDGTYRQRTFREDVAETADALGVDCVFVHVECDEDVVRERIAQRTDGVSDATFQNHLELKSEFDAFQRHHITIDNSGAWERTREQLSGAFPVTDTARR